MSSGTSRRASARRKSSKAVRKESMNKVSLVRPASGEFRVSMDDVVDLRSRKSLDEQEYALKDNKESIELLCRNIVENFWDSAWGICADRFYNGNAPVFIALELRDTWLRIIESQYLDQDQSREANFSADMFHQDDPPPPLITDSPSTEMFLNSRQPPQRTRISLNEEVANLGGSGEPQATKKMKKTKSKSKGKKVRIGKTPRSGRKSGRKDKSKKGKKGKKTKRTEITFAEHHEEKFLEDKALDAVEEEKPRCIPPPSPPPPEVPWEVIYMSKRKIGEAEDLSPSISQEYRFLGLQPWSPAQCGGPTGSGMFKDVTQSESTVAGAVPKTNLAKGMAAAAATEAESEAAEASGKDTASEAKKPLLDEMEGEGDEGEEVDGTMIGSKDSKEIPTIRVAPEEPSDTFNPANVSDASASKALLIKKGELELLALADPDNDLKEMKSPVNVLERLDNLLVADSDYVVDILKPNEAEEIHGVRQSEDTTVHRQSGLRKDAKKIPKASIAVKDLVPSTQSQKGKGKAQPTAGAAGEVRKSKGHGRVSNSNMEAKSTPSIRKVSNSSKGHAPSSRKGSNSSKGHGHKAGKRGT